MQVGLLALLATLFFSLEAVITDVGLSRRFPPMLLQVFLTSGLALASCLTYAWNKSQGQMEWQVRGIDFLLIGGVIAVWYAAEFCYLSFLHRGGGAVLMTTCYVLIPVICSMLKFELPSWKLVLAWVLGGLALWLTYSETGVSE